MKHDDKYTALLDLYVDGELPLEAAAEVQAHLATCSECRAYVDDALAIRAAFPDVENTRVPAGFAEGVLAAMERAPSVKKKKTAQWQKVLLPMAACLAVIVLVQSGPHSHQQKTAPDAESETPQVAAYDVSRASVPEAASEAAPLPQDSNERVTNSSKDFAKPSSTLPAADEAPPTQTSPPGEEAPATAPVLYNAAPAPLPAAQAAPCPILTLSSEEAGELLSAYTPVQETDTDLWYELSQAEYTALLSALDSPPPVSSADLDPEISSVSVRVLKPET